MASRFLSSHDRGLDTPPPLDSWTAMTQSILDNHHDDYNHHDDGYHNDDDDENDDDDDENHFAAVTSDEKVSRSGWGIYDDINDDDD